MGNAITSDMRALWLMLQKNGGWWTVSMLAHHWRRTFAVFEIEQAMDALEAGGFIASHNHFGHVSYAITSDCNALPDLPTPSQPGALA